MRVHIKLLRFPAWRSCHPTPPLDPGPEDLDEIADVAGGSGWVTTKVAAAALGVATRTIRDYIRRGELVAKSEGEGVQRTWLVSVNSLQDLRSRGTGKTRRDRGGARRDDPGEDLAEFIEAEEERAELAAGQGSPADIEVLREMLLRLEIRTHEAGELRARLQITERAESTLREDLARERERADQERGRAERLEEELKEARKGFWRRLFGR